MPRIIFVDAHDKEYEVQVKVGTTLLEAAREADAPLEGACEGSLACSTCHVVLDQDTFDEQEPITIEEEDMLDMAFGVTDTSRLGCQIVVTDAMDGIKIRIPRAR